MSRVLLLALLAGGAACSAQTSGAGAPPGGPAADSVRGNLPPSRPPFRIEKLGAFQAPFAMAFLPDGGLLVTEKSGALRLRAGDGAVTTVGGAPAVATGGQGGLLDVAVAPDFASSHVIYLSFAEPRPAGSSLALWRGRLTVGAGQTPSLTGGEVLWRAGSDGKGGQFGATILFAQDGQSLFLASGERQRFTPAQDPDQALGKILHLTLDGKPWPGNPQAGKIGAATVSVIDPPADTAAAASAPARATTFDGPNFAPAATWTSGHRNPYGLAFDRAGRLWEVEMGPKGGDEVNLIVKGRNYGWPIVSNGDNYDGLPIPDHRPGDGFEAPRLWWNPSISPGGMMIYTGAMFPQWRGNMFVAALSGKALIRVHLDGDTARPGDQWDMGTRIRDVTQAPDGAIWLLEDGERGAAGQLLRLTPMK
ncbi:PQQ-dependent sugar dehydrogenase [uncultured Sphingomonas sp.]|uniref:PQQ-dependent sugar dehydrogenase n=1 Tax=uncultured Sphingomonas sp. TaxID=158754 RepID=UPI0035CA935D